MNIIHSGNTQNTFPIHRTPPQLWYHLTHLSTREVTLLISMQLKITGLS